MPTYVFECPACHRVEDRLHVPVAERDDPKHQPTCPDHGPMPRTVAPTSFALKGKGWYKDGYSKA